MYWKIQNGEPVDLGIQGSIDDGKRDRRIAGNDKSKKHIL
jgi:hypothetical protein